VLGVFGGQGPHAHVSSPTQQVEAHLCLMMRGQFVPHVPQRLQGAGEVHRRAGSIMHR
jgi:hypothetical protein